jgi:hypothetical protein
MGQMISPPLPWICVDIETRNPSESEIQAAFAGWKPAGNVKDPEKIEAQRIEAERKIKSKAGLLPAAPICSIAIQSPLECRVFHTLKPGQLDGVAHVPFESEPAMLLALRQYLDAWCPEQTKIVGHNVKGFDLPKLRLRFVRLGLRLPQILNPTTTVEVHDTMTLFARYFLGKRDDFVSLDEMSRELGIANGGKFFTGADVPGLVEEGRHAEIVLYNATDAVLTARAWQILTSQVGA